VVEPIAYLLFVMMFGNGEASWEESVVESNEGTNNGRSKKGHLVKVKYLDFWRKSWIQVNECLYVLTNLGRMPTCLGWLIVLDIRISPLCIGIFRSKMCRTTI
jgi:hypothetical protein